MTELGVDVVAGHHSHDVQSMEVSASSGGILRLDGNVKSLEVDVSSGGVMQAQSLQSRHAEAEASSGGVAKFTVSESLEAVASSGVVAGDGSAQGNSAARVRWRRSWQNLPKRNLWQRPGVNLKKKRRRLNE